MSMDGFRKYLRGKGLPEDLIERSAAQAERFDAFMRGPGRPGSVEKARPLDANAFAALLIKEKSSSAENIVALARYSFFCGNHAAFVAFVETVDGAEALDNLYAKVGKELGNRARDEVFRDVSLPPIGTPNTEKPRHMQAVLERLERKVGEERCRGFLRDSLRDLPDEGYLDQKRLYEEAGSLDAYLERKGRDFVAQLEELKREGKPYFTQTITDEVIEFVKSHPEIREGVRKGNVVYEAKIPYMAREYLAETDPRMKAYYYCHCPWARESLQRGEARVSRTFCNCSAAFHRKPYEIIFGQRLEVEVLETVLAGDPWCRFAIHLPADAI